MELGSFHDYWPGSLALFQEYWPGFFFRNIGGGTCFVSGMLVQELSFFSGIEAWKLGFLQEYMPGSLTPFSGIFAWQLDICFRKIGCELWSFFMNIGLEA